MKTAATDLPVLKPFRAAPIAPSGFAAPMLLSAGFVAGVAIVFAASLAGAQATAPAARDGAVTILLRWAPLIFQGFLFNLLISVLSMALGTAVGVLFGIGQVSPSAIMRQPSWAATQFFRNAPWLVLLFYAMFLLPFEIRLGPVTIAFPAWVKAIIGLALPVAANVSEIVRGGIRSIPTGQWESAEALAFDPDRGDRDLHRKRRAIGPPSGGLAQRRRLGRLFGLPVEAIVLPDEDGAAG